MRVIAHCPKCDAGLLVTAAEAPESIKCGGCGHVLALTFSDAIRRDARVDVCPVCRGGDFYIRKDFDPKVGLTIIIAGAVVSAVFYWFGRDVIAYSLLAAAALIDLVVYGRLEDLAVCYRCHTEFRGGPARSPSAFDLHTADVLEQEYERRTGRR